MTTTINADDGVISGSAGLKSTPDSSGELGLQTNGVTKANITPAGLFQFNSGYGSVATAYGCRAWVNFNGTGTVAIRASGNVSSITDNGPGDYTVNFTTAMPDANYAFVGTISNTGSASYNTAAISANGTLTRTTSAYRFTCTGISGTTNAAFDPNFVNVSIFR
jgi:hypothetical protein